MLYHLLLSYWHEHQATILKTFTTLAAPGGIWFWIDKYRNRVRIRIRDLKLALTGSDPKAIAFEAENVSSMLNSYEPSLSLTGYHSEGDGKCTKFEYVFTENGNDRQLPPHIAKQILVRHDEKDKPEIIFLWLMTLTLSPTRGHKVRVRIRNAEFQPIRPLRFHWERFLLLIFRKLP
jgi:hypothetical protein